MKIKPSVLLVTGSCGLIGGAVATHFLERGTEVIGIDNDGRTEFFGPEASTSSFATVLKSRYKNYKHYDIDIADQDLTSRIFLDHLPDAIVHAAAQPSHDKATSIILRDLEVNTVGTVNLLEHTRTIVPNSPFIFLSTNKVYGDSPNNHGLREEETRFEFEPPFFQSGISEKQTVDQSKHSLFGCSKLAADVYVQEYGRYFGLKTCALRGGCLTGPGHKGVELHGFLNYLIKCIIEKREYTIQGFNGKQVRDNIHAQDVASFCDHFIQTPKSGEVYNIGGGWKNSVSIIEAISIVEKMLSTSGNFTYSERPRIGDHVVYYSDLSKIKSHFPDWKVEVDLQGIIEDIINGFLSDSK